jgi:hypothetical protein
MVSRSVEVLRPALAVSLLLALCSCGSSPGSWSGPVGNEDDTAQVSLTLATVPAKVQCIRVTARGSSTVTKDFPVSPGASTTAPLSLGQLPLGSVSITGEAFDSACGTSSQQPSWIADPQTVNLKAGVIASLTLTFRPDNPVAGNTNFVGNVVQVALGLTETDVVLGDGTVEASGFGNGGLFDTSTFGLVPGLSRIAQIAPFSSELTSCAVLTDGTVECWGDGSVGELGNGTNSNSSTPVPVTKLAGATQICAGGVHACALGAGGVVQCWGSNMNGQLGAGSLAGSNTPFVLNNVGVALTSLTCGDSHTCAVDGIDGRPVCWGSNSNGQMGDGTNNDILTPRFVTSLQDITQIAAGGLHTCALRADGSVFCWGSNGFGELGDGTLFGRTSPVQVPLTNAVQIAVNGVHSCARKSDGTVWCWGDGKYLGTGTGTTSSTPVQIHGMPSSTAISMGGSDGSGACSAGTDLAVYCWGPNNLGQLGKGPGAPSSFVPTPIKL